MRIDSDSVQDCLYRQLARSPDRQALGFYDRHHNTSWLTAGELFESARAAAGGLEMHGLSPGDVCILVTGNDEFSVSALLGALILGAVPMLVAPPIIQGTNSSLPEILDSVVRRTRASLVVAVTSLESMGEDLRARHLETTFVFGKSALVAGANPVVDCAHPGPNDIAAMQLTSGTTAMPRICVWSQRRMLAALDGIADAMGIEAHDIHVNWTPLYHDMGLVNNFLLCMTKGIPLVMLSPFDFVKRPALWLRAISDVGATTTWSPNFGFALATRRAKDEELEGVELHHVAGFWNAAERIHHETIDAFCRRFAPLGVRNEMIKTNFGCAENIGGSTFTSPERGVVVEFIDIEDFRRRQTARVVAREPDANVDECLAVVSAGRPHSGIEIHILDDAGDRLADGLVGELALDTPSRMDSYLGDPEATAAAFHNGLLKTGDVGYTRDNEFFWTGRVRERIVTRGRKVDPSEFENILLDVEGLREGNFAAFGIDALEVGTERVVIVSEVREPLPAAPAEIIENVRGRVSERFGFDVEVVLVGQGTLAKTSSGKRRHQHFRALYQRGELAGFEISCAEGP